MGYYSEVVIAVHKDKVESFETACAELLKYADGKSLFKEHPTEGTFYSWHSIKWYEDAPVVLAYYQWEESVEPHTYAFVRIGEDWDDMERSGYLDCSLGVDRSITVPCRV